MEFYRDLERVSKNKDRFLISKRGEAKAVILGIEDCLRNILNSRKFQDKNGKVCP